MILLPCDLPPAVSKLLSSVNEVKNIQDLIENLTSAMVSIGQVKEVISSYWTAKDSIFSVKTSRETVSEKELENILSVWKESGLHDNILHDLKKRNSAISFSSYNWPYPSTSNLRINQGINFNFPRPYSILVPFSSTLLFSLESEIHFSGYHGLFFDEFPDLNDQVVQLVISLPEAISGALSAFLRK